SRNALQRALLRTLGGQAIHDHVAFGDFNLNCVVEIGKRRQEEADELFEPRTGWWHTRGNHMVNVIRRHKRVHGIHVTLVNDLLNKPADNGFVLLDGHGIPPDRYGSARVSYMRACEATPPAHAKEPAPARCTRLGSPENHAAARVQE